MTSGDKSRRRSRCTLRARTTRSGARERRGSRRGLLLSRRFAKRSSRGCAPSRRRSFLSTSTGGTPFARTAVATTTRNSPPSPPTPPLPPGRDPTATRGPTRPTTTRKRHPPNPSILARVPTGTTAKVITDTTTATSHPTHPLPPPIKLKAKLHLP